jgi:hypothetical protein
MPVAAANPKLLLIDGHHVPSLSGPGESHLRIWVVANQGVMDS